MPLEQELIRRLREARERCDPHIGQRLLVMLNQYGPIEALQRLLREDRIQSGLIKLWKCNLLELSMVKLVLDFAHLFDEETRNIARQRLRDLGMVI